MKSSLKSLLLWVCLSYSALAADLSVLMADIEPKPLNSPPQASKIVIPFDEAPETAEAGSALDDFAFANKAPNGSSPATGPAAAMPHLEGF